MKEKSLYAHVNQNRLSSCMPQTGSVLTACSYRFEKEVIIRESSCKAICDLSAFLSKSSLSCDQPSGDGLKVANYSYSALWAYLPPCPDPNQLTNCKSSLNGLTGKGRLEKKIYLPSWPQGTWESRLGSGHRHTDQKHQSGPKEMWQEGWTGHHPREHRACWHGHEWFKSATQRTSAAFQLSAIWTAICTVLKPLMREKTFHPQVGNAGKSSAGFIHGQT